MSPSDTLFVEPDAAAQSLKSAWTRMASTYGSMRVELLPNELTIQPRWYIGWLNFFLRLDLAHEIPVSRIRAVKEAGTWWKHGKVELRFTTREGEDRKVLLYLKRHHEFMDALEGARKS